MEYLKRASGANEMDPWSVRCRRPPSLPPVPPDGRAACRAARHDLTALRTHRRLRPWNRSRAASALSEE